MNHEAAVFRWLRARQLTHTVQDLWRKSRSRFVTAVACTLLITSVVFGISLEGFILFQRQSVAAGGLIIGMVFDYLFLTLGVLLVFSGGLILYGSLFTAPEAAFLLALPARADRIFADKFVSAVGWSSWAFALLGLPVLAAFGLVYGVHWTYWLTLPLLLIGFLPLPGAIGSLACLLIVNFFPRRRQQVFGTIALILLAVIVWCAYRWISAALVTNVTDRDALSTLLGRIDFASTAWAPSHWMTTALQASAQGKYQEAAYRLALVWSNGLFAFLIAAWVSSRLYRRGYNRLHTGGSMRRRYGGAWMDRIASTCLGFLDQPTRLLIIKDFRTFRRDPGQWLQIVIFAALGLIYFANTRQFYRGEMGRTFQHGVCLVNVVATCLLLCAYMGRFIYPMLSLEGKKFWILGLMPIGRDQLLIGKFAFALAGALLVAAPLMLTVDVLLGMPMAAIALHAVAAVGVSFGLSGLAVGIGAQLPNFRETDPSKIAVGFGGTVNLLAGLLFLLLEIALVAGPYHIHAVLWPDDRPSTWYTVFIVASASAGVAFAAAATLIPLRAGRRSLEAMEF